MSANTPIEPGLVKRELLDAVAEEHIVLHGHLAHIAQTSQIDWSRGSRDLWKLWQSELRGFKAPPPEPTPTSYDEARIALAMFQRAVEELTATASEPTEADSTESVVVDPRDVAILRALDKRAPQLCYLVDLEAEDCGTRKTISKRLTKLVEKDLAVRPDGERTGATITPAGRQLLLRCPPS